MNAPRALDSKKRSKQDRVFTVLVHKDHYKSNPARVSRRRPGEGAERTRSYSPKQQYSPEELIDADISDLESDIRCAERDNLPEYAAQCRAKLAKLKAQRSGGEPVRLGGPKPSYMEGFQLTPYEPSEYATEGEIRHRMTRLDDHLLAEYPQLLEQFPRWLEDHADNNGTGKFEGEVYESDIVEYLSDTLHVPPHDHVIASIIEQMQLAKILLLGNAGQTRLFFPSVGEEPPFTNEIEGTAWALAQVGYEPSLAQDVIDLLDGFVKDEDDEISRYDLSDALTDWTKHRSNFVTEDSAGDMIIDALLKANVLVETPTGGDLFYDGNVAGRADPYMLTFLRNKRDDYKKKGHTRLVKIMADRIIDIERNLGRAKIPPAGKAPPKNTRTVHVPKAPNYSYPAVTVAELRPGQEVYGLTDDGNWVTITAVIPGNGDFYKVMFMNRRAEGLSKRAKGDKLVGLLKEAPPPADPEPPTHLDVPPLRIDDPNLLTILAQFEGRDWMLKQRKYPRCPKCVHANQQAWNVLKQLGDKGKGLRIEHLLDDGGRIQGNEKYGHWFVIDENGNVVVDSDTVSDSARTAMLEVGISST